MYLEGDEAMRCSLVHKVGAWYAVEPCADTVAYSLDACVIPFAVSECRLRRLIFDGIEPSVAGLIIDTGRPCTRRRVDLELIAMHTAILVLRNACRTELYSRVESVIDLEVELKDEVREVLVECKEGIRSIVLCGTYDHSVLYNVLGIAVDALPSLEVLAVEDFTPVVLREAAYCHKGQKGRNHDSFHFSVIFLSFLLFRKRSV